MDEKSYWICLMMAMGHVRSGLPRPESRFFCEGFMPRCYLLGRRNPRITGAVGFRVSDVWDDWTFTLALPSAPKSRESIDWDSLLPATADGLTRWVTIDAPAKHVLIVPVPGESETAAAGHAAPPVEAREP